MYFARELIDVVFASPLHQMLSVDISAFYTSTGFICACLLCLCYPFKEKIREKTDVRGVEAGGIVTGTKGCLLDSTQAV